MHFFTCEWLNEQVYKYYRFSFAFDFDFERWFDLFELFDMVRDTDLSAKAKLIRMTDFGGSDYCG